MDVVMKKVIDVVSNYYGINTFINSKAHKYAECRYVIWYFLRFKIDSPYRVTTIARKFKKDHSTVSDGIIRLEGLLKYEKPKQKEMKDIERLLANALNHTPKNLFNGKSSITVRGDFGVRPRKIRTVA